MINVAKYGIEFLTVRYLCFPIMNPAELWPVGF